ncbi:MAG: hypothetical protein LBG58_09495, partial [Planctomycetaceae bacterium]|nr:hypothetical protein [Planctomycetaceae bacterium]
MGSTVKNAWIAILLVFFAWIGTTLDSKILLAQGTRVYTHYWDGAGTRQRSSLWSSVYSMWDYGVNTDAKGDAAKYFDNWLRSDHIAAKYGEPTYPAFSQGGSPLFAVAIGQTPYDQVWTTTPDGYYFQSSTLGYTYDLGFRSDQRTVVNDVYVSGPNYWFMGAGFIGNRLDLYGGALLTGFSGKNSFAYGVHWEAGNIEIFDSTGVFDQYTWSPNYNLTKLRNDWDPIQLDALEEPPTGYNSITGDVIYGTYALTDADAKRINREHNTLFVMADNLTIGKSNTIGGGVDYTLMNRFDIGEGNTLNFYTPLRLSFSISGVNAFASNPAAGEEFHVPGGAIYLRSGADIDRSVVGSGSNQFGRFDLRGNYGYQGGAIYSDQNLTLKGNSLISGNLAAYQGGAVYMAGTQAENRLTLDTKDGDIGFRNNYSFADSGNEYKKLNLYLLDPDSGLPTAYITNPTGQVFSSDRSTILDYLIVRMSPTDTIGTDDGQWFQVNTNDFFIADNGTPVKYLPRYYTYTSSTLSSSTTWGWFDTSQSNPEYTTSYTDPKFYKADSTGQYFLTDTGNNTADYRQLFYEQTYTYTLNGRPVSYTYYNPINDIDAAWYQINVNTDQIRGTAQILNPPSSTTEITTDIKYHYDPNSTDPYVNRWLPYNSNYGRYYYYDGGYLISNQVYVDYKAFDLGGNLSKWYYVDQYGNVLLGKNSSIIVDYVVNVPSTVTPGLYEVQRDPIYNTVQQSRNGNVVVLADDGTPVAPNGTNWYKIDPVTGAFVNPDGTLVKEYSGAFYIVAWDEDNNRIGAVKADGTFVADDNPGAANSGAQAITDSGKAAYVVVSNVTEKTPSVQSPTELGAVSAPSYTTTALTPSVTAQTVTSQTGPDPLIPYSDAIFLKQNTQLLVTGTHRVFMNDNITSNAGGTEDGGNSMLVDLTGTQANAFIQFGTNTDSLLNPDTKPGGQVTVRNGTLRILNGARFQTKGLDALFTVEANGIIAGGGTGGKSNPNEPFDDANPAQVSGTFGAAKGFLIYGTISPDSFEFITPDDLTGVRWDLPTSDKIGYLNLWGNVTLDGGTLRVDVDSYAASNDALQTAFDKNSNGTKDVDESLFNSDIILIDKIQETAGSGQLLLSKDNKSKIDIVTWPAALPIGGGKYVIAASWVGINDKDQPSIFVTNDNIENYFEPIIPQGVSTTQAKRSTAALSIAEDLLGLGERDLVLQASNDGNVKLVWTAKNTGNNRIQTIWNSESSAAPYTNWIRLDTLTKPDSPMEIPLPFRNGDVIYFDTVHNQDKEPYQVRPSESWSVGGMVIEGGTYNFAAGQSIYIRGTSKYSTGVNAIGRLDITRLDTASAETSVTLQVHTDFEKGTRIGNFTTDEKVDNITVNLVYDDSLGRYDLARGYRVQNVDTLAGSYYDSAALTGKDLEQNERGAVYLKNADAKIVTSVWSDNRTLQNHFELANSNLTLEIPNGTNLTISNVDTSNSVLSNGNDQSHKGGAFYIDADSTMVRSTASKLTLENNTARNGGAIYAEGNLTVQGNTLFKGNTAADFSPATGRGGAIYLEGVSTGGGIPANVILNTANGDIVFTGNTDDVIDSNSKYYNSLFLNENIALQITGNNNVFFDDPIKSGVSGGNSSFTKTGTGIVQFQGENVLNHQDYSGGTVNITGGTFRLAGDKPGSVTNNVAEFYTHSINDAAAFNVTGATLAGQGSVIVTKGNAFTDSYGFNFSNATISPDSAVLKSAVDGGTAKLEIENNEKIGMLTLEGSNVTLANSKILVDIGQTSGTGTAGDSDLIQFDGNVQFKNTQTLTATPVDGTSQTNGEYKILEITSGSKHFLGSDGITAIITTDQLKQYLQLSTASSSRLNGGDIELRNNGTEIWLVGFSGFNNGKLYWIGGDSTSPNVWNTAVVNWQNGAPNGSPDQFYNNDFVTFDSNAVTVNTHSVTLAANQTVSGMDVTNGGFDITGTGIIKGVTGGNVQGANGKLTVGGGTTAAELTLGVETQFVAGTELKENGKIVIANEKALGTYNHTNFNAGTPDKQGYVDVTGNGTIATDSINHAITNRFNVATNKKLTIDTSVAAEKLTVSGVNVGTDATGVVVLGSNATLEKTGTGTLVFTGNTATNGGVIYGSGDFTINAAEGDIVFNNNTGDAIYSNGGKVTVTGNTGSRVYLGNTINTTDFDLTGSVTAIVNDTSTTITGTATIGTGINSDKSVLYVANGKNFTAPTFNLKKYAELTGSGTITATTINLSGTLNPSNDTYTLTSSNLIQHTPIANTATLNFVGATKLDGATLEVTLGTPTDADKINVTGTLTYGANNTIHISQFSDGTYDILTNNSALPTNIADHFVVDTASQGARNSYELQIKSTDNKTLQLVSKSGGAIDLYWSANQSSSTDTTWYTFDTLKQNWVAPEHAPNVPQYFQGGNNSQAGDTVNFNNENYVRSKNVTLDGGNHVVRDMYVYGGGSQYVFNATDNTSKITGTGDLTIGESKTGIRSSGDAEFNVALDFAGAVSIYDSAVSFKETLKAGSLFIDPSDVTFDKAVTVAGNTTIIDDDTKVTYNAELKTNQLHITDAEVTLNAANTFTNNTQLDGS